MASAPAYRALEGRFRRLALVREAAGMLQWDMAAVMPSGGAAVRGEQMAALKEIAHEILTAPEVSEVLQQAAVEGARGDLDDWELANLREMRRAWLYAAALPAGLVGRHSRAVSECEMEWRERRAADDFAGLLPRLRVVLALTREIARARAEVLGTTPYEALLDEFEPGGSTAEIDALFGELVAFLPDLVSRVIERQAREVSPPEPTGPFPADLQKQVAERLMRALGFDFTHGRLDTSHHPFCGGVPEDVRITTRWDESDFLRGMMAVLHETGHALYERGLPARWRHQPVGLGRGMSVHESQSLVIEMQACRSREFFEFLAPIVAGSFGGNGPAWEAGALHRRATRVRRSLIRVDADEVTYPLHVILRYRLERAMIAGDLEPADLPGAWREGARELLGVTPPDDRSGCLQDIHWFGGAWGYFPTYTLGALTAAHLFAAACAAVPDIHGGIARGDFSALREWLGARVHARGSLLPTRELVTQAAGRPLDTAVFRRHLEARYLG
jgi:carboxypeptidase Taq